MSASTAAERARRRAPNRPEAARRQLVDIEEFARVVGGVNHRAVRRWIHAGKLPAYRLGGPGGKIRVDLRDIELVVQRADPDQVSA
jgi:excisionase family DNA binding protein